MKKFKDFQPTAMDSKGVGSEGQEDWLVLPTSRTRDTGPIEESNFAAALERLGGKSDTVQVHRFGHWGPGWFEIIVVHPSRESEAEEIEKSLENYPVLDEDDMSRRETEEAWEDWKNWGESEFKDIIKGLVELDEEQDDMLDYHVDLAALWHEVSNHLNWSEQHDGHSTNFNFKGAERYLSDNTELIFDAIDAAHSSPKYLAAQKKTEDEKLDRWHKATRGHNPGTPIARWESRGGKHFAELYDNGDGTYSYRSDGASGYMGAMSLEQAMSEMEKKIKYLAPSALKLGLMRVESPPAEDSILRRTNAFTAVPSASGVGVKIIANASGVTPKSKTISMSTWNQIKDVSDQEFDGTVSLELGVGAFRSKRQSSNPSGENPLPPNKYPLIEVNGRMFASHRDAYDFAMDRANESGEEVVIMQKDDSMLPWFMLQKVHPQPSGGERYYEGMGGSPSSNPPTAYIDFAGGAFVMWENADGDRHLLGRSESIGDLARQIRDYGYKRVVLTAEAADRDVDRHGWRLLGQGSPGGSPGNAYGKASEYLKSSLHGVDVRPNPERFDPAYRVFGYGRKGRISAGMTVKIAGTNQSGRVVMPSSEPNHWVINMGGRHGTPKVVHEDNLITRGG